MEKENDIQQPQQPAEAAASRYSDYTVLTSRGIHRFVKCRKGDRWVVLKGLKPEYREKPQCVALLKKEYKTAHALDHAGLVKYQALVDDDRYGPCIELECVDGRSLADYLREAHTTEEKLAVVQELADVLSYVHGRGVVHLGLKPSNIYITKQGNHVKLSDFRIVAADSLKEPVGVLKYMAPEVKDGTMTVDARADIYSLGMLLRDFALPADYAPVADKCCSFGRNERYMDAASVMEALYSDRSHGGSKKTVGHRRSHRGGHRSAGFRVFHRPRQSQRQCQSGIRDERGRQCAISLRVPRRSLHSLCRGSCPDGKCRPRGRRRQVRIPRTVEAGPLPRPRQAVPTLPRPQGRRGR